MLSRYAYIERAGPTKWEAWDLHGDTLAHGRSFLLMADMLCDRGYIVRIVTERAVEHVPYLR